MEYVGRETEKIVTTNTVEGYYSIFKRGMNSISTAARSTFTAGIRFPLFEPRSAWR
jgi:hypothetical protein